jgi:hypothetical protein
MANEQKQKIYICHDFNNKKIWIATVNYQRIAKLEF